MKISQDYEGIVEQIQCFFFNLEQKIHLFKTSTRLISMVSNPISIVVVVVDIVVAFVFVQKSEKIYLVKKHLGQKKVKPKKF